MKYTSIKIPEALAKRLEKQANEKGYSLESYIVQILREASIGEIRVSDFTDEDEERVKERLKKLGYL